MNYNFIVIEGNIGAGKTSLAHMLSKDLGAAIILEQFADNKYLEKFYKEPAKYVFQLETSFLIDRFNQLKNNFLLAEGPFVADYFFAKSMIFAMNNLKGEEMARFKEEYDKLALQIPQPDLVIYLKNTVPNLQKNIKCRGRQFESNIENEYLENISKQYDAYFQTIKHIPVLEIDIEDKDFMRKHGFYTAIWKLIHNDWPLGLTRISL